MWVRKKIQTVPRQAQLNALLNRTIQTNGNFPGSYGEAPDQPASVAGALLKVFVIAKNIVLVLQRQMARATCGGVVGGFRFCIRHIHGIYPVAIPEFGRRAFTPAGTLTHHSYFYSSPLTNFPSGPFEGSAVRCLACLVNFHYGNSAVGEGSPILVLFR